MLLVIAAIVFCACIGAIVIFAPRKSGSSAATHSHVQFGDSMAMSHCKALTPWDTSGLLIEAPLRESSDKPR